MSEYNELVNGLKWLVTQRLAPRPEFIRALLGNGRGQVAVPDRPDYSYVRPNRTTDTAFEVFNKIVDGVEDLPVLIGEFPWQPGLTQVLDIDWESYKGVGWGGDYSKVGPHGPTHEWGPNGPASDTFNVWTRQLAPMRTYAGGSGSMSVFVVPYDFDYIGTPKSWPGLPGLDLTAARPATGTARYMLTYLDMEANTVGVITGTVDIDSPAINLPKPGMVTGTLWKPSAYVKLYGGQGSILERDIDDARQLWGGVQQTTGPASGDLTGTYPSPTVLALRGHDVADEVPAEGEILTFTGSAWRPRPAGVSAGGGVPSGPAGGDLTGTYPDPQVAGIHGWAVDDEAPADGDLLIWSGSAYHPHPVGTAAIWQAWTGEAFNLDFSGTDYDTKAEAEAMGLAFSDAETFPDGIMLANDLTGTWAHAAGYGWHADGLPVEGKGVAIMWPMHRAGDWEIEIELNYNAAGVDEYGILYLGYMTAAAHVGAYGRIYDLDGAATELTISGNTNSSTNPVTPNYSTYYTGSELAGAGVRTYKVRVLNGVFAVYDDQDDAWHLQQSRSNYAFFSPAYGFLMIARPAGVAEADMWALYVQRLKLTYL